MLNAFRRMLYGITGLRPAHRTDSFETPGAAMVRRDALDQLYRGTTLAHEKGKLPEVHGGVIAHVAWFHIAMSELEELELLIDGVLAGDGHAINALRQRLNESPALMLDGLEPFPEPSPRPGPCPFRPINPFDAVAAAVLLDRIDGTREKDTIGRMLGYYLSRAAPAGAALRSAEELARGRIGVDEFAALLEEVGQMAGGHGEPEHSALHGDHDPMSPHGDDWPPFPERNKWDPCTLDWGHCAIGAAGIVDGAIRDENVPVLIGSADPEAVCYEQLPGTITLYPAGSTGFPASPPAGTEGGLVLYDGTNVHPLTASAWSSGQIQVTIPTAAQPGCAQIYWQSPHMAGLDIAEALGGDCANLFPPKPVGLILPPPASPGRIEISIVGEPTITFGVGGQPTATAQGCQPVTLEWKVSIGLCLNLTLLPIRSLDPVLLGTPTGGYARVSLSVNGNQIFSDLPWEGKHTVADAVTTQYTLTVQTFAGNTRCGIFTKDVTITRTAILSVSVPDRVHRPGRRVPVTVRIPCPAPAGGLQVNLTSSIPGSLTNGTAFIPEGRTEALTDLEASGSQYVSVQLTGTTPGYQDGSTTVLIGPTSCLPVGMVQDPRRYGGEWRVVTTIPQVVGIHMAMLHTGKVLLFSYREGTIGGRSGAVFACLRAAIPALTACDLSYATARASCVSSRDAALAACDSSFACATESQCASVTCPPCTGGGPQRWLCDAGRGVCLLGCNTARLLCEGLRAACKGVAWLSYGICEAAAAVSMVTCKAGVIVGTAACALASAGQAFWDWLFGAAPAPDELAYNIAHSSRASCVLWDPTTNTTQNVSLGRNLFCAGHAFLGDGRLLVASGQFPAPLLDGVPLDSPLAGRGAAYDLNLFDPVSESWTRLPDMAEGRWYPTVVTLADGRVLVMSGTAAVFASPPGIRNSIEVFGVSGTPATLTRVLSEPLPGQHVPSNPHNKINSVCAPWYFYHLYPFAHVLPNRSVFVHWKRQTADCMAELPPNADRWRDHWTGPLYASCRGRTWKYTKYEFSRTGPGPGTSVILPFKPIRSESGAVSYPPARIMIVGGGGLEGSSDPPILDETQTLNNTIPATNTSEILDYGVLDDWDIPDWRWTGLDQDNPSFMNYGRVMPDTVLLPDGNVLVVNGAQMGMSGGFLIHFGSPLGASRPALTPEVFDPETETWDELCKAKVEERVERLYHATALLLPDGRVVVAGHDGFLNMPQPNASRYEIEVFSPPYLFRGPRPIITSAPASVTYGSTFTVGVDDASKVASVALLRGASVTHQTNTDQRYVGLSINWSNVGTVLSLQAPTDGGIAPPGYYMLFVLNKEDVPSIARWVRLGQT